MPTLPTPRIATPLPRLRTVPPFRVLLIRCSPVTLPVVPRSVLLRCAWLVLFHYSTFARVRSTLRYVVPLHGDFVLHTHTPVPTHSVPCPTITTRSTFPHHTHTYAPHCCCSSRFPFYYRYPTTTTAARTRLPHHGCAPHHLYRYFCCCPGFAACGSVWFVVVVTVYAFTLYVAFLLRGSFGWLLLRRCAGALFTPACFAFVARFAVVATHRGIGWQRAARYCAPN